MAHESIATAELLDAAQAGDGAAVNNLMARYQQGVERLVQLRLDKKVRRRSDVSDVVQNVMIEAYRRLRGFLEDRPMPFKLWIRQIARDRIIDAYRRHRGSVKRSVDQEQNLEVTSSNSESSAGMSALLSDRRPSPADVVMQKEMSKRVSDCIAELDEKDATIIAMRHYDHLTNQEISQAMGITEPAASMRYLRAVRRLKEIVERDLGTSA